MDKKLRVLLVDDEELALELLKKKISELENIEIVGLCHNGFEAVKACGQLKPDLVFLDIEMPKLSGFDVIELLNKEEMPHIVFVTAYNDYAVEAFEKEAIDYIVKPASIDRIKKSIERVRKIKKPESGQLAEKISDISNMQETISRILIKNGNDVVIVKTDDIIYIKAEDDYIRIFTKDQNYLKNGRLSQLEEKLPSDIFIKVHRSYIINISYLKKIEPYLKDSRIAILEGKIKIPISKSGYLKLKDIF